MYSLAVSCLPVLTTSFAMSRSRMRLTTPSAVELIRTESAASIAFDSVLVVAPPSSSAVDLRHQPRRQHARITATHSGCSSHESFENIIPGALSADDTVSHVSDDDLEAAAAETFRYLEAPAVGVDCREANLFVLARPDGIALTRAQSGSYFACQTESQSHIGQLRIMVSIMLSRFVPVSEPSINVCESHSHFNP